MPVEEQKQTNQPSPPLPAVSAPATAPKKRSLVADGFKNRTRGEGLFNQLTYTGLGYFGVTGFSIFLTWFLRDFKAVAPHFNKFAEGVVKSVRESKIPLVPKFEKLVNSNITIATLFVGGTAVSVLPIKALEDHKAGIVKKLDELLYGKAKADNDPQIQQAHAEMEALPKQTWKSVFASRGLAFAATYATSMLMGSEKTPFSKLLSKKGDTATGRSIDSVAIDIGRGADRYLHEWHPNSKQIGAEIDAARAASMVTAHGTPKQRDIVRSGPHTDRTMSRILSYVAMDGFYTLITSQALFVFTRVLAPMFDKKPKQAALPAPAPVTPVPFDAPASPDHAAAPKLQLGSAKHEGRLENGLQRAAQLS